MRPTSTYRASRRNAERAPEVRLERKAQKRRALEVERAAFVSAPALTQAQRFARGKTLEADRRAALQASKARAALAWAFLHPKLPSSQALIKAQAHG